MKFLVRFWKWIKKLFKKEDENQKVQIGDNSKIINSKISQIGKIENYVINNYYYLGEQEKEIKKLKKSKFKPFSIEETSELSLWIIDDRPGVKEELIKENIWNMRLEAWVDKDGKKNLNFWLVEKEDFKRKKLFQNKILTTNIIDERNKMIVLKVQKDNKKLRETIQKLQAINITETVLTDKSVAKDYKGHEVWLLEKDKVREILEKDNIKSKT